ncbi:hypothetical protein BX666DRAFT_2025558 [Dichotomocladium elegans]|nr:hypothetical protein BX666DRAFT_2025558 [Dichotomocladium elegans]
MLHWPTTFHFKRRLVHRWTNDHTTVKNTAIVSRSTPCSPPPVFQTSVPCEILHLIFSELSFKDRLRCVRVCRSWRAIILNWPHMWRDLSTRQGCDIGLALNPYRAHIPSSAVHKVYFDYTDFGVDNESTAPMARTIDFLIRQRCSNIREAELNGFFDTPATFISFARLTSPGLRRLVIKCHDDKISTMQVLNTVLRWCPQLDTLVCFTVAGWPSKSTADLLSGLVPHRNLTSLTVQTRRQVQLPMHTIVERFPKLRTLAVPAGNCENVDLLLEALDRCCSDIESICISTPDTNSPSLRLLNPPPGSLRKLVVADYRLPVSAVPSGSGNDPVPTDHLHRLLRKHSATLEALTLGDATALNQATMALLASLDFPSLLVYTRATGVHDPKPVEYDPHHLCGFLSRCPRLEAIHLVDRGTDDQVLGCLQTLSSLRSLQLHYSDRVSSSALTNLLRSRPLEHVSLHSVQAMSDSVLRDLNTSRLRTLHITFCKQISVGAGLRPLLATILGKLEELEVTCTLVSTDTGALLESVFGTMSKVASSWKVKFHRQQDYYPHPKLSLITDTHWHRRQSYYRDILAHMN